MTKEKIINYAMSTPHNTNEAVLSAIIDQHNKEILGNAEFVKTVNGQGPDEQGNVEIEASGGVSSWNDLTDKPFEDGEYKTIYENETENLSLNPASSAPYRFGLLDKDLSEFIVFKPGNNQYIVTIDGTPYNAVATTDNTSRIRLSNYDVEAPYTEYDDGFMFHSDPGATMQGLVSTYFSKSFNEVVSLKIEHVISPVVQLDPKFLPNEAVTEKELNTTFEEKHTWESLPDKPFYEIVSDPIEIVPEAAYTVESLSYEVWGFDVYIDSSSTFNGFIEGETYIVNFDNTEYTCVAYYKEDWDMITIGEIGQEYPFICYFERLEYPMFCFQVEEEMLDKNILVSISHIPIEIQKLDPKFLPEHSHKWEDIKNPPFGEEEIFLVEPREFPKDAGETSFGPPDILTVGSYYTLYIGNEVHEVQCTAGTNLGGEEIIQIGPISGVHIYNYASGYGSYIEVTYEAPEDNAIAGHALIGLAQTTVTTLDPKFLPETHMIFPMLHVSNGKLYTSTGDAVSIFEYAKSYKPFYVCTDHSEEYDDLEILFYNEYNTYYSPEKEGTCGDIEEEYYKVYVHSRERTLSETITKSQYDELNSHWKTMFGIES